MSKALRLHTQAVFYATRFEVGFLKRYCPVTGRDMWTRRVPARAAGVVRDTACWSLSPC